MRSRSLSGGLGLCALLLACALCRAPATAQSRAFQLVGRPLPTQTVRFNVHLPLRNIAQLDQLIENQSSPNSPLYGHFLTPAQFRASFGPAAVDLERAAAALRAAGFAVIAISSQNITAQGSVAALERTFRTRVMAVRSPRGTLSFQTAAPLVVPAALTQLGATVTGFFPANRFHPHVMRSAAPLPNNRVSPRGDYWFTDLKQAYEYPTAQSVTGAGRVIATLISGDFKNADMDAYFSHELLATPKLVRRPVFGGAPFDPSGGSVETTFDIQQLGGMAPGATIVHYNIPDLSDSAIIAGYTAVVEDNVVDILSSSFGGCEKFYQPAYNNGVDMTGVLRVFDDLFRQGNAQGITFVASSGDNGGLGCLDPAYLLTPPTNPPSVVGRFIPGIESPASSPNVTAVGGTNLVTSFNPPSLQSTYVRENADFDPLVPYDPYGVGNLASGGVWQGGGGESIFYAKPLYQLGANTGTTNRAVPDVSLHMGGCPTISNYPKNPSTGRPACPEDRSGDYAILDGQLIGLVGTSASSPDLAGLLALEEQAMGGKRLGNVNVQIYALAVLNAASPSKFYHQNIPGNNGLFTAHPGYNLVVGNGTVIGRNFVGLPNAPPAGDPQTPSNP